jgi:hypothetical protein
MQKEERKEGRFADGWLDVSLGTLVSFYIRYLYGVVDVFLLLCFCVDNQNKGICRKIFLLNVKKRIERKWKNALRSDAFVWTF